ncbi:hypothetical protein ACET3Z_008023 [Daucus carota]
MHETRAHPTAIVSVPSTLNTQKNPVLESHVVSRRTSIYLLPYKQHILPDLTCYSLHSTNNKRINQLSSVSNTYSSHTRLSYSGFFISLPASLVCSI